MEILFTFSSRGNVETVKANLCRLTVSTRNVTTETPQICLPGTNEVLGFDSEHHIKQDVAGTCQHLEGRGMKSENSKPPTA